ncbi:MAG: hypothetical protein JXA25_01410 [Anaerolineales bacterium]|nr:hypothetical protein [Anaerolineales bacterium]
MLVANQILNAGNAITAFSLLLYALTFNLKERIARSFAILLAFVTLVYFFDVLASTSSTASEIGMWLRLQWFGIAFIPAAYIQLTDALLEITNGRSTVWRRFIHIPAFLLSFLFFIAVMTTDYITGGVLSSGRASYLKPGPFFWFFLVYFLAALCMAGFNFLQAYRRGRTPTSKRRMRYLLAGAVGPVLGVFPFLMIGGELIAGSMVLFWFIVGVTTILVAGMLVLMSYSIAYFGISSPDRVVKTRLAQWILRGPIVASTMLAASVLVNRASQHFGLENSRLVPFTTVAVLLVLQFMITLIRPSYERLLFWSERDELYKFKQLEDRLLTSKDMRQYLEAVLDAACDVTGARSGFIGVTEQGGIGIEVAVGAERIGENHEVPSLLQISESEEVPGVGKIFYWQNYQLFPLRESAGTDIIGILGLYDADAEFIGSSETLGTLKMLSERIVVALKDRMLQREVINAVDRLVIKVGEVQELRAAATYTGREAFSRPALPFSTEADLVKMVKDALMHYWGGPRLTHSPLMRLRIVKRVTEEGDGNPVNGLRAILKEAMEQVKPEGERKLTPEWLLYNILDMKFIEGRKVRDIAMRLSLSEADLYRKQRIAIKAIANAISDMESEEMIGNSGRLN